MSRDLLDKKRKLFNESVRLRNLSMKLNNYNKQKEIRLEQDDLYKRLKFYEKYEKASRCIKC